MRRLKMAVTIGGAATALVLAAGPALAQTFNSGSTGADGALSPTANTTISLPGSGVFNYTTINIPSGVTVKFARNATNTPVTLLASGNVTIAGTIDVNGAAGGSGSSSTVLASNAGASGPGGADGGAGTNAVVSTIGGAGRGPGGGAAGGSAAGNGGGGGFVAAGGNANGSGIPGVGGATYGSAPLLPLIGGSGGGGGGATFGTTGAGGGGGGGALLIASSGTITLTGSILAKGGDYGTGPSYGGAGSGGSVRLIATTITGTGTITVTGGAQGGPSSAHSGAGSAGRVRIEAYTNTAVITFGNVPSATVSVALPSTVTLANAPVLTIASVAGVAAPAAPGASLSSPDVMLPATTANPVTVALAATNIPPGTNVTVTVAGQTGGSTSTAVALAGTTAYSTASVSVTIPTTQPSVISATATFLLSSYAPGAPVYAQGEEVEGVRVEAGVGRVSEVHYSTKSGRVVPASSL